MERKVGDCPLGSKCEEVRGDVLYTCPWYTKLKGQHPQTGLVVDESQCAIAWLPVLLCESARQQQSTGAAIESFRNEMVQGNISTLQLLLGVTSSDR